MRKLAHRLVFGFILLAGVGSSIGWLLWFPYDPLRLYRAIPDTATFISEHDHLSERWDSLVQNPLIQNLVASLDPDSGEVRANLKSKDTEFLIRRLAGRKALLAYVPLYEGTGGPAWVLVSWCGTTGQWLRWGFIPGISSVLQPTEFQSGRRGWTLRNDKNPDEHLSVSVTEGILLACYSRDPAGVRYMVNRLECPATLHRELRLRGGQGGDGAGSALGPYARRLMGESPYGTAGDRGWLATRRLLQTLPRRGDFRVALTACSKDRVSGWAGLAPQIMASTVTDGEEPDLISATDREAEMDSLAGFLGDSPAALWVGPYGRVEPVVFGQDTSRPWRAIGGLLRRELATNATSFICLPKPAWFGRILKVKAATLIMGVRVRRVEAIPSLITEAADLANTAYDVGIIAKPVETEDGVLVELGGAGEGVLGRLASEERPAFAGFRDWLVFSSNRAALEKFMRDWKTAEAPGTAPVWRAAATTRVSESVAWFDLDASYKVIGNVQGLLGLLSYATEMDGADDIRERLAMGREILEVARSMKTACLWFVPSGQALEMRFHVGR